MPASIDVYNAAVRLDETPVELLNGGADAGLRALEASAGLSQELATSWGVDHHAVADLWNRAETSLRAAPEADTLFEAAADAAVLLYAAAWFLQADEITADDLEQLL